MKYLLSLLPLLFTACIHQDIKITKKYNNYGLEDTNGNILVKHKYKKISAFTKDGFSIVKTYGNKFGIIDINDKFLLEPIYDHIGEFYNSYAKIKIDNKIGLIDKDFRVILKPQFDEIDEFTTSTTIVKLNDLYGCIDESLKMKLEPKYSYIYPSSTNFRKIKNENKWGLINKECLIIIPIEFSSIEELPQGIIKVKKKEKSIFYNYNGEKINRP